MVADKRRDGQVADDVDRRAHDKVGERRWCGQQSHTKH
jgi:hypothetical protein